MRNGLWPVKECRPARRATILTVSIRETDSSIAYTVNVRRLVAHHPVVVGADVEPANIIAPDDEDVWLILRQRIRSHGDSQQYPQYNQ